jgi:GH25 family lysozyme M1 (1,4-beta-N-acetylmuramidase)
MRAVIAISFLLAFVAAQPVSGASSTLRGVDVSHWNGAPNWARVQQDGVRFVIAKATEGTTFKDGRYPATKQQLDALALPLGAYHYARPDKSTGDATAEADWFVDYAQLTGANLLPVLDLEDTGGLGTQRLTTWVKDWLSAVQAKLGVKAIIYTSPSFWKEFMGNSRWFADHGYRLWVAHWTSSTSPRVPASNWGGRGWTMWQHDNCGSVAGIDGCVDRDRYNGTGLAPLRIKNNR